MFRSAAVCISAPPKGRPGATRMATGFISNPCNMTTMREHCASTSTPSLVGILTAWPPSRATGSVVGAGLSGGGSSAALTVNGSSIKARGWWEDEDEPAAWAIDLSDGSYASGGLAINPGWVGLATDLYWCGVGTESDAAPSAAPGPGPLPAHRLPQRGGTVPERHLYLRKNHPPTAAVATPRGAPSDARGAVKT